MIFFIRKGTEDGLVLSGNDCIDGNVGECFSVSNTVDKQVREPIVVAPSL